MDDELDDPVAMGARPPRSRAQQRAEALRRVCLSFLGGGDPRRARPRLIALLDTAVHDGDIDRVEILLRTVGGRVRVSAETGQRVACDGVVQPVVVKGAVPLAVGGSYDPISRALRTALIARDGGCRFPGCTAPVQWCDVHHIVASSRGGPTSEANTGLFCRPCHVLIHEGGWRVKLNADRSVTARRGRWQFISQPRLRPPPGGPSP